MEHLACKNTDRELWRGPDDGNGSYYADSVHVTEGGAIGMNVGGSVIVMRPREWHAACKEAADLLTKLEAMEAERDSLLEGIRALHKVWWTVGADLDKDAVAQQCLKLFKLLPTQFADKNG